MKVLLLTPDFPPDVGGIQRLLYNFAKYTKFKVTVIAPFTKGAKFFDNKQEFKILRIPKLRSKIWFLFMLLKAIKIAVKERPDILLCGHIVVGPIGYLLNRIFGIPYAVYTHGLEIMAKRRTVFYILKHALIVFVVNEFCKKWLLELGVKEAKIKKVYPGIDVNFFNPNIDPAPAVEKYDLRGKKVILTVSRLDARERYKGHDETLRALPRVIKEFPSLKYIIVGDGTDKPRLQSLVNELNLNEHVLFTGEISDMEIAQLYVACEFFIMPSKEVREGKKLKVEGFGIVYAEAGACGKPVIAGKSGGTVEAVIDGITGLLVDPADESIADAMINLLKDKNLRERLGNQARQRVRSEMEVKKVAYKIDDILFTMSKNHSTGVRDVKLCRVKKQKFY